MNIPASWYDMAGRIRQANAVASCALEALPNRHDSCVDLNHAANLIAAVQDMLTLAEQDADKLEAQLMAV